MLSAHDRQRDGDVVSSTQAEDAENPAVKRDRTNNWWSQGGGRAGAELKETCFKGKYFFFLLNIIERPTAQAAGLSMLF